MAENKKMSEVCRDTQNEITVKLIGEEEELRLVIDGLVMYNDEVEVIEYDTNEENGTHRADVSNDSETNKDKMCPKCKIYSKVLDEVWHELCGDTQEAISKKLLRLGL